MQEVAGKIMSLVYEFADASQRKQLLGSLSHTLGTGKRSAVNESKIDSVGQMGQLELNCPRQDLIHTNKCAALQMIWAIPS